MNYYNENILDDIPSSVKKHPLFNRWYEIVEYILKSDEFQKRKVFMHHYNMSVWDHSILVSFNSYITSCYLGADSYVSAVAGLLHDFYDQAWIDTDDIRLLDNGIHTKNLDIKLPLFKKHGFTHASEAARNYIKYFPELENKKITNSIKRHMFPLNIIPPRYIEGWIITIVDKLDSVHELPDINYVPNKIKNKFMSILIKNKI